MFEFFSGLRFRSKVVALVIVVFVAIMAIAISILDYSRANLATTWQEKLTGRELSSGVRGIQASSSNQFLQRPDILGGGQVIC